MKQISFTDNENHLRPDAFATWLAHKYFPADEASRRQGVMLFEDERQRFLASQGVDWKPSAISMKVLEWAGGKTGQLVAAGYTALAFILLEQRGTENPTLYAAANVVAKALAEYRKTDYFPVKTYRFDGEWSMNDQRLPTGYRDVRRAFEDHRSVAHLAAADIVSGQHFLLMHVFNRTPETFAMTLLTAQKIEADLDRSAPKEFVDYWSVRGGLPVEAIDLVPAEIEGDARTFLEAGL